MNLIRLANVNDIDNLIKIKPQLTREEISKRLLRQKEGDVEYLVLEKDSELLSFAFLKYKGKKTHPEYPDIEDLYTKNGQRRNGYATKLIKECEKRAKEKGFGKIGLAVNPKLNRDAMKFYEKIGYRHDGKKSYIDAVYNGKEDWVVDLEKKL